MAKATVTEESKSQVGRAMEKLEGERERVNLIKRNEWFYGDDVKGFDGDDRCGKRKRGRQRGHDGLGAFAIQPALEERERERGGERHRERERERERGRERDQS